MHWLLIIFRSVSALLALFFLTKLLGKKQVSQLSAFDYVIGISMGNIAAEMTINADVAFFDGIIAMTSYSSVSFIISILTLKSLSLRRLLSGTPIILIQDGKIIRKNLKKSLIDINELMQECRGSGYFNIDDIAYAILEPCGKLSFLPKTKNRPVQLKDLKLKDTVAGLCANVIADGEIIDKNLAIIKKTKHWLLKEIKKQGYENLESIFLATVDVNYNVTIFERIDDIKCKNVLE